MRLLLRTVLLATFVGLVPALAASALVVLDSRVSDADVLLADTDAEVLRVGAGESLAARLASVQGTFESVHIVAHGAPGVVFIGNRPLTSHSAADMAALAPRLTARASVLLWSCYSGLDSGLLRAIADASGAGVAASSNVTGKGGDWVLERSYGDVSVSNPFAAADVWAHALQPVYVYQVGPGATLDINPLSQLIPNYPASGHDRITVNHTTVPGTTQGVMYRLSGVSAYVWGSGAPNAFQPFTGGSNDHMIFAGNGFRYEANAGATIGANDDIPITVRDATGFNAFNAILRMTIANVFYPVITQQPIQNPQTNPGMTAQLQVAASIPTPPTTGTLQYQWFSGISPNAASPIGGQTSATFTWNVPGGQALGQYWFWCRVTLVGQGFTASQTGTITVTNQTASVASLVCGTTPTNSNSIQYQLDFAAAGPAVGGLAASNFNLTTTGGITGASVTSAVSGLGGTLPYPTWFITVNTGTGDGTIRLNLNNATGASIGISGLPYTGGTVVTIDKTRPVVNSSVRVNASPSGASSVQYTVTFSESVTGVSTGNFSISAVGVTGASVTSVTGSGATRTVTINTGSGDGTLQLRVNQSLSSIVDAVGNQMNAAFTTGQTYTIDKNAPTVTGITRVDANPTAAASVNFTVTFSEPVTGVAAGNFTFGGSGISGVGIAAITGTGATRNVQVNTGTGSGTLSLLLSSLSPAIQDTAGNNVTATFNSGESYTFDRTAPVVSAITRVNSNPTNAVNLDFLVTFSEAVTGVDTGNFSLAVTGSVAGANVTSVTGSGTTRTVTVARGTGEGDMELELSSAAPAITDALSNALTATFNSGEAYTIDLTPPGISIATPTPASTNNGPVQFVVTYMDFTNITLAAGDITLTGTGGVTGDVAIINAVPNERTVVVSNLVGLGTLGISIAAGTATDFAGNAALAAGPSAEATVLGGPPTISIGAPSASITAGGPISFEITYGIANAITLANTDVTLNVTGSVTGTVAVSGTGLVTRTVTISGLTGDGDFTISIAADTASNAGGNAPAAGPSAAVNVDNTVPVITAATAFDVYQGGNVTAQHLADVSDTFSGFAVDVAATTVPTGLTVSAIAADGSGVVTGTVATLSTLAPGAYVFTLTASDQAGNTATADVTVNVLANALPTITAILDQSIAMNGNTGALTFDVDDADEGPNALIVTVSANNQVLVDLFTDIALGGAGMARTLTITPQADHVGVSIITVTVHDSVGAQASVSFTLTVTDSLDAPALAGLTDIVILRDQTSQAFTFTATDPQGDITLTPPQAFSSNQSLILDASIVITGTAPNFSFTVTPEAGQLGTLELTFFVTDGTHTASRTISVEITNPPSSSGGGDDDKDEDCSTGGGSRHWPAFLATIALTLLAVRQRRARA